MASLYSAPSLSAIKVGQFRGSDSSVPEDQIELYRAERSENMMPQAAGEVCKRPGVQYERELPVESFVHGLEERVEAVIGGKHIITAKTEDFFITAKDVITTTVYRIYAAYNDAVFYITAAAGNRPVAIRQGDEYVIFAANSAEIRAHEFYVEDGGGLINKGGVMVFLGESSAIAYTSEGIRTTYDLATGSFSAYAVIEPDDDRLTTPIIVAGADNLGGGTPFKKVNLLSPWVTEGFCCKGEQASVFYLNARASDITDYSVVWTDIDTLNEEFKVEVMIAVQEGEGDQKQEVIRWVERALAQGDRFRPAANRLFLAPENNTNGSYINPETGETVTGVNVGTGTDGWIGASPIEGEDNVRITHRRPAFSESFIQLCAAACGTSFGVGGYKDRLFIAGGELGNRIYYAELENPFYIGDLNYIETEPGNTVMAIDGTDDAMAILTNGGIYFASAQTTESTDTALQVSDAVFTISTKIQAPAPISVGNTAVLGNEIVYLSGRGVVAVSYKDQFDKRFAEYRSALIDRDMLKDAPTELIGFGRYLMIRCAGGVWWLLDENQPSGGGNRPYASHQYEGWRLTGMEADAAWVDGESLKIAKGTVICGWKKGTTAEEFHDQYGADVSTGMAITAWWETPYIYGSQFYKNKIFLRLGVLLGSIDGTNTAILVEGKKNAEDWKTLWVYDGKMSAFNYANMDYRLFTYLSDPGNPNLSGKIRIKKANRFKLRFSNDLYDQPFILREFGLDYVEEE